MRLWLCGGLLHCKTRAGSRAPRSKLRFLPLVKNESWFLTTCGQISLNQPPPLIYFMLDNHNKGKGRADLFKIHCCKRCSRQLRQRLLCFYLLLPRLRATLSEILDLFSTSCHLFTGGELSCGELVLIPFGPTSKLSDRILQRGTEGEDMFKFIGKGLNLLLQNGT